MHRVIVLFQHRRLRPAMMAIRMEMRLASTAEDRAIVATPIFATLDLRLLCGLSKAYQTPLTALKLMDVNTVKGM